MKIQNWKDESELWDFIRPRLRGWWRRLELSYPNGFCDSVGLFDERTIWLEHKVGLPSKKLFTPDQIEFAHQCLRHRVPYYTCFGHKREVWVFTGLDFTRPIWPPWWIVPTQAPSATRADVPAAPAAGRRRLRVDA